MPRSVEARPSSFAGGRSRQIFVAIVLLIACVGVTAAQEALPKQQTTITYLTASTVYVGAGRNDGLDPGDVIEVVRQGRIVARLEVVELSSRRSSCHLLEGEEKLEVGDVVRFVPRVREAEPESLPTPVVAAAETQRAASGGAGSKSPADRSEKRRRRSLRELGMRGRIGLRYLAVRDRSGGSSDFSQPALDARIEGNNVAGSAIGFSLDVRTRRTYRQLSDGGSETASRSRVYRAAVRWNEPGQPLRVTVGRQYAPALSNLSYFDGALGEWRQGRWSTGLFTGSQPDQETFGYSNQIREHGAFFQLRSALGKTRPWAVTTGVIGSYDGGEINREYLYTQGRYTGRRLSGYLIQEFDVNRGWRKEVEGTTLTNSSTYLNLRYRLSEEIAVYGGFDNRRQIRLWRDIETPETEFDDSYRQGSWVGAAWRVSQHIRTSFDARISRGGVAGDADSYTLTASALRMTRWALDLRARNTRYTNARTAGWLHSFSAGADVGERLHLELSGGLRNETARDVAESDRNVTWYGVDADLSLGRRWYALASWERTSGADESNDQVYLSVVWRF